MVEYESDRNRELCDKNSIKMENCMYFVYCQYYVWQFFKRVKSFIHATERDRETEGYSMLLQTETSQDIVIVLRKYCVRTIA